MRQSTRARTTCWATRSRSITQSFGTTTSSIPLRRWWLEPRTRREVGKNFSIVSETGPLLLRKMLETILDSERKMTQPANRATAVITPGNYEMTVNELETVEGRNCMTVAIKPRRVSPYLFNGTIWVDARDQSIVQLQGVAAKSPSMLTGPSEVFRQYTLIDGFSMATHAKAVSNSSLLGQTIIKIDYTGYQMQLRMAK